MTVSMTQKSAKKKSKKSSKGTADPSVLGSLRSTRPTRLGGSRRAGAKAAAKPKATRSPTKKPKKAKAAAKKAPAAAAQRPAPPPPPKPRSDDGRPSGAEIVTTAVQAVGELAQIGATVGSQLLRRAAQRIPRP
jgi:hypothetical protein